jgi:hypothetical protein
MQTFDKQPGDELDYDADFSAWLPDGDTITSATAVPDKVGELEITSVEINTPIVKVWTKAGVNRTTYKITVTASTAGGRVKEVEFRLRIKDQ